MSELWGLFLIPPPYRPLFCTHCPSYPTPSPARHYLMKNDRAGSEIVIMDTCLFFIENYSRKLFNHLRPKETLRKSKLLGYTYPDLFGLLRSPRARKKEPLKSNTHCAERIATLSLSPGFFFPSYTELIKDFKQGKSSLKFQKL